MITNQQIDEYIKLQRTGIKASDIAVGFAKTVEDDMATIAGHLPESCNSILDIGCGIGGIDLSLYNRYNGTPELYLFDYSESDEEIYYGYREKTSAYNSLELTRLFLSMNGVNKRNINLCEVNNGFPEGKYDVIISLISCGFHYPVGTYLAEIKASKAGIIILDIRKGTNQIDTLKANFDSVKVVADYQKYERVVIK